MRLAIIGLRESFYPHFVPQPFTPACVLGGHGHETQAVELGKQWNVPCVKSVAEALAVGCDAALVGNWFCDRPAQIIELLEAGVPVLAQKLLAADYPHSVQVVAAAKRTGTMLMSGSFHRHSPAFREALAQSGSPQWGRPVFGRFIMPHGMGEGEDRRDCGGMVTCYAVHPLSPLIAFGGGRVERVSAMGGVFGSTPRASEDTVVVTVQFDNDAIAIAEVLACQTPVCATTPVMELHFSKKSAHIPFLEGHGREWFGPIIHNGEMWTLITGLARWVSVFEEAVKTGRPPVPLEEYVEVAAALHMARLSLDEKRMVDRAEIERNQT